MAEEMKTEEPKADADAGEKLDMILKHVDSLSKRMDALECMDDAEEEYDDAEDEEVLEDAEDEDEEMADAEEPEFEGEPKAVAADKRKDGETDPIKGDVGKDAAKADAMSAIAKRIADVEKMIPRQLSDAEHAAFGDVQAKADSVYQAFGDSAPRPLQGESLLGYRRRLARGLQKHSARLKDVNLASVKDAAALEFMESQIYSDAMAAALSPVDVPQGALRELKSKDITGRIISTFVGQPRDWMGGHSVNRRRLVGVNKTAH